MNKQSTSLEALEIIKDRCTIASGWCEEPISNVCRYEVELIEKHLKALEIIKERQVNMYYLLEADSVETYNEIIDMKYATYENFYLTQKQFNLLKEVL